MLLGVHQVRTGADRAFGTRIRRLIAVSAGNRFSSFASGFGAAILLQSSTAVAFITAAFAGQNLIALPAAIAVMLGADVGTTVAAQILTFDIKWLWTAFVVLGVALFLGQSSDRAKGIGSIFLGLGLLMLSLHELGQAAVAMRSSEAVRFVLRGVGADTSIALLVSALLTWAAHSSLAIVLLIASLAQAGAIDADTATLFVIGANVGGALAPCITLSKAPPAARRVPMGNLMLRSAVAIAVLPFAKTAMGHLSTVVSDPAHLVVAGHMGFNLTVAANGLFLVSPLAAALQKIDKDKPEVSSVGQPRYLDQSVINSPTDALAAATREALHMGDYLAGMLRDALTAIEHSDPLLIKKVTDADNSVDLLNEKIKLYLLKIPHDAMSETDMKRQAEILSFTMNLEHIGDIIDKSLMGLAAKKISREVMFSAEGLAEIREFHARVTDAMRLAFSVLETRDPNLARKLIENKSEIRFAERGATQNHFTRLLRGVSESLITS